MERIRLAMSEPVFEVAQIEGYILLWLAVSLHGPGQVRQYAPVA